MLVCFLSDRLTARVSDLSDVFLVMSPCSQISDINLLSTMLLLLIEMINKTMKISQNYVLVQQITLYRVNQQTGSYRGNATQQTSSFSELTPLTAG